MKIVSPYQDYTVPTRSNWLVTFADLIALVLAFFVMMYATHRVEQGDWQSMVKSLSRSLNAQAEIQQTPSAASNVRLISRPTAMELSYLEALLRGLQRSEPLLSKILLHRLDDRLIIALPGNLLFHPGRADPMEEAAKRIAVLANVLRSNQIGSCRWHGPRWWLQCCKQLVIPKNWERSVSPIPGSTISRKLGRRVGS
jgi:chemotaxis protein MotB